MSAAGYGPISRGRRSENPGFVDRDSGFEKATFCRLHTWNPQSTYKHGGVVYVINNCAYWKIQGSGVRERKCKVKNAKWRM